jgi:hypothetical protein
LLARPKRKQRTKSIMKNNNHHEDNIINNNPMTKLIN